MSGDVHVRFWERLRVQFPGSTHPSMCLFDCLQPLSFILFTEIHVLVSAAIVGG